MWGKSKGTGYKQPSTLPSLRQASRGGEPPRPPRKKTQQRIGPKTFDEYWNDEWRKIEKDKINNAPPQMRDFLQARKAREAAVDAGEIAVLEREHVAFMQGSNTLHLLSVLTGGALLCSDFLRSLSRATFAKDAGNGTGDVCYFRFVKDTRPRGDLDLGIVKQNINYFSSVGASGGIFYVLRASEVSGLTYRTASSTDSQGKGTSTIELVVGSRRWAKNGNNTEIGFSRAVNFARISEVYIGSTLQGGVDLGDPIYNNAVALLEELEGKGILLPEKWKRLSGIKKRSCWWIDLLGFFMEMAGFQKMGNVQTSKGEFDVFERTGEPDYVRGFQYIPRRKAYPYPLKIPQEIPLEEDSATATQESLAEHAEASEETLPAEHAVASKPAPRAKPAADSGQTIPKKRTKSSAPAKIVKPKVGAGAGR